MKVEYCFPGGRIKALTMSYDDGKLADEKLVEIFNRHGIKGTFNLNYGLLDKEDTVKRDKVKTLYAGHEVATHTLTHPNLIRSTLTEAAREILEDRIGLETLVGYPVRGHAWPFGAFNEDLKKLLPSLGIAYARTVFGGNLALPQDPMAWAATCHHNDDLMERAHRFAENKSPYHLECMYVWGHSYEFDSDHNWELIEEFCAYMGGREDIWYATNIEIIDYMQICNNLQFGAAKEFVYNPSAKSAWLLADGKVIEVAGGKQILL